MREKIIAGVVDGIRVPTPRKPSIQTSSDGNLLVDTNQVLTQPNNLRRTLQKRRYTLARKWRVTPKDIRITIPRSKEQAVKTENPQKIVTSQKPSPEQVIYQRLASAGPYIVTGDELIFLRKQIGLSREDLAKLSHVPIDTIRHIETGKVTLPTQRTRDALRHVLVTAYDAKKALAQTQQVEPEQIPISSIIRRVLVTPRKERTPIQISDSMSLGQILATARGVTGFTQKMLGDIADISKSLIDKIERGVKDPTLTTIHKLCDALKLSDEDPVRLALVSRLSKIHRDRARTHISS